MNSCFFPPLLINWIQDFSFSPKIGWGWIGSSQSCPWWGEGRGGQNKEPMQETPTQLLFWGFLNFIWGAAQVWAGRRFLLDWGRRKSFILAQCWEVKIDFPSSSVPHLIQFLGKAEGYPGNWGAKMGKLAPSSFYSFVIKYSVLCSRGKEIQVCSGIRLILFPSHPENHKEKEKLLQFLEEKTIYLCLVDNPKFINNLQDN